MKLTAMSKEVFEYVKANGGRVSIPELAGAVGRSERSVGANATDLQKKGLIIREKAAADEGDKTITYIVLTDEGKAFVPSDEE